MMRHALLVLMGLAAAGLVAGPAIDDTPTRVQTTLDTGLDLVGTLRPKSAHEISTSHWALDCAGTDREHVDYHAFKDYLEPLGIRRLRTQAGWARTERERGFHDFSWLDSIVFDAQRRGLEVWLEASYGNPMYPGGGGRGLGAGLPHSPEALAAWDRWVAAMAKRYRGAVRDWCIWNEPDLSGENGLDAVFDLTFRSARIIKREIPDARLAACAITKPDPAFAEAFCRRLRDSGEAGLFTWFAYHHYTNNPDDGYDKVEELRAVVKRYAPNLRLWQNESGVESEWCRSGALCRQHWTELKQAKWDLRRYLADLGRGDDTAVFHICDLDYHTTKTVQFGLCRYGLLKTEGQDRDFKVSKVKMAYYAVQNAVSVFNDAVETADLKATLSGLKRPALYGFRDVKTQVPLAVFWDAENVPSNDNATQEVELSLPGAPLVDPVWVDVLTGNAFLVPKDRISVRDGRTSYRLPAYDSPAFVTSRTVLDLELSEYARAVAERIAVDRAKPVRKARFYGAHPLSDRYGTTAEYAASSVRSAELQAVEGCFDFAPFAGRALALPKEGARPVPEIAGALAFRVRASTDMTVPVYVRCDWFWQFSVNGRAEKADEGNDLFWKSGEITLKAGWNDILFWTRPGNDGRWFAEIRLGNGVEIEE